MGSFCLGLSGFRLEFGDSGVVFGLGVIFQNDFLHFPDHAVQYFFRIYSKIWYINKCSVFPDWVVTSS